MQIAQELEQLFEKSFTQQADIAAIREFHANTAYCLDEADNLIGLTARFTAIVSLKIPSSFKKLQYLNISDNENLTTITFEKPLPELTHLDLSDNKLKAFKLLEGFDKIEWLDIRGNALKTFYPTGHYPHLRHLDLSNNALEKFQADWLSKFTALERLYLRANELSGQKKSFTEQPGSCMEPMLRFQKALLQGKTTKNKEFKVLVVGDGGVGKSCLVERLILGTFGEEHHSTQGIALSIYREEDFPYVLNIWDFGGQDIYHATHRMFMQDNAIYLALWDMYSQKNELSKPIKENNEERRYDNYRLRYWLHYISVFGKESPVIVVKTKSANDLEDHPERKYFQEVYGQILQPLKFLKLDSKFPEEAPDSFEELLFMLRSIIKKKYKDNELPESWDNIRSWVRDRFAEKIKLVSFDDFKAYVADQSQQESLHDIVNWLNNTGVFFYREGHFNNRIVLDQNWMIEAVYAIFDREHPYYYLSNIQRKQRYFKGKDIARIWKNKNTQYAEADMQLFLDFMLTCEIIFEDTYEENEHPSFFDRRFVAPQLLDEEQPIEVQRIREREEVVYTRFRHPFLHYGFIQSFIIQTAHLAKLDQIWKKGTIIYDEETKCRAVILAKKDELYVELPRDGVKTLNKIRNLFEKLRENVEIVEEFSLDGKFYVAKSKLTGWSAPIIEATDGETMQPIETAKLAIFLEEDKQVNFKEKKTSETQKQHDLKAKITALRKFIKEADFEEAMSGFEEIAPKMKDDIAVLAAKLSRLEKDLAKGKIKYEEFLQYNSQISDALLQFIKQFEQEQTE